MKFAWIRWAAIAISVALLAVGSFTSEAPLQLLGLGLCFSFALVMVSEGSEVRRYSELRPSASRSQPQTVEGIYRVRLLCVLLLIACALFFLAILLRILPMPGKAWWLAWFSMGMILGFLIATIFPKRSADLTAAEHNKWLASMGPPSMPPPEMPREAGLMRWAEHITFVIIVATPLSQAVASFSFGALEAFFIPAFVALVLLRGLARIKRKHHGIGDPQAREMIVTTSVPVRGPTSVVPGLVLTGFIAGFLILFLMVPSVGYVPFARAILGDVLLLLAVGYGIAMKKWWQRIPVADTPPAAD